ncbi:MULTISPECIES: hypothetical protein [unclassified Duganella]|uniref:hypothetical protein n=1 Tax=unclassified Duganella TaxID=2636909 RepID=UPI000A5203D9|nr:MULTISPECIES: hypothetical protein [unclassified Duganella]
MIADLPQDALLQRYREQGAYTDCFAIDVPGQVPHAAFVEAFYTSAVFKLERLLLALFVARPSRDAEARELASGQRQQFAAWSVEGRAPGQLLMCDYAGSTRSWLMALPAGQGTRLYFGSAVVRSRQGGVFRALLGFHKLYSRILLRAAASRVLRT